MADTANETKPAETQTAPTTPTEGETKPTEGSNETNESQVKKASLDFMSHQCGVLVIMKGGHMVDNAPWQKVEQLNVECETAGQGDPYGDCTTPGNYANMGSCEIGGGVRIEKVTQKYKLSDTIPGTSWTFADYMGTTTKAYGKTNERFNAMMADEEKRTRFVQQAQYLKQVLALVGVGEKDITILSTIRDTGSAAHPYGLTVDFTVNNTKRNHEVAKKLYTMQRQGKLCANQIIWEMKAPNPKAVSKSSTEDNLNTSNAPGSQLVPTACNPSAGSSDSSSSTDTGSSSDSSSSTDTGNSNSSGSSNDTSTKPVDPCKSTESTTVDWITVGDAMVVNYFSYIAKKGKKKPIAQYSATKMRPGEVEQKVRSLSTSNVHGRNVVISPGFMTLGLTTNLQDLYADLAATAVKTLFKKGASKVYVVGHCDGYYMRTQGVVNTSAVTWVKACYRKMKEKLGSTYGSRLVWLPNAEIGYSINMQSPLYFPSSNSSFWQKYPDVSKTQKRWTKDCIKS